MPWTSFRYSLYAPIYDLLAWPLRGARRRAVTQAAIGPDDHVLIVGCGTGLDLAHIPRGCRVTATDLSVRKLASMRRRARALGRDVSAQRMNAEDLDFPDGNDSEGFDVVLVHLIAAVVPDGRAAVAEATRVLKTGGTLSLFDKFRSGPEPSPGLLRRLLNVPARLFFSDINRRAKDLTAGLPLEKITETPVAFGGLFRALTFTKSARKPLSNGFPR